MDGYIDLLNVICVQWKPSCKQGSAKFSYDGVCPDPEVFGVAIGPGKAPTWKMKKINKDELQDALGSLQASVRQGSSSYEIPNGSTELNLTGMTRCGLLAQMLRCAIPPMKVPSRSLEHMANNRFAQLARRTLPVAMLPIFIHS